VEHEVEWWTLLFFMLLFAIAGGLEEQGITRNVADKLMAASKDGPGPMTPFVIALSSVGSAFVDNIVFVAAFTRSSKPSSSAPRLLGPLVGHALWRLLRRQYHRRRLHGQTSSPFGCWSGAAHAYIGFLEWLKIGLLVGAASGLLVWGLLSVMPMPHPSRTRQRTRAGRHPRGPYLSPLPHD
jgi:di/tricarboxylate transporter